MTSQKRENVSWLILILCLAFQPLNSFASDDEMIPLPPVESIDTSFFEIRGEIFVVLQKI